MTNLRNTYSRLEYFSTSRVEFLTKVFMKRFFWLGIVASSLAVAPPVHAGGYFSLNIGLPPVSVHIGSAPRPVYVQPAPVYVAPPPVYALPPRVIVSPPPIYVRPAPVYVPRRVVLAPRPVVVCRKHHRHWHCR
jgi:hypothetical protein